MSPQLYFYILGVAVVKSLFLMQMKHQQSNESRLVLRSTSVPFSALNRANVSNAAPSIDDRLDLALWYAVF
jgi:hypothetical protein